MKQILLIMTLIGSSLGCGDDHREPPPIKSDKSNNSDSAPDAGDDPDGSNPNNSATNGTPNNGMPDNGMSNNGTPNNETPNNANSGTPDMGTPDEGTPDDLPNGEICPYDDPGDFVGMCDPVRLTGCTSPEACLSGVMIVGSDTTLSAFCQDATGHERAHGEACNDDPNSCAPGTHCVSFLGQCRRLCFAEDSLGCEPGEWCRRPSSTWPGLGFCDVDCNL